MQANDMEVWLGNHTEQDRPPYIGKVIVASTMVAGLALSGAPSAAPTPIDHTSVALANAVRTLRGVVPWPIDDTLSGAVCGPATGNTCSDVDYPVLFGDMGIGWGADMLDDALQDTTTPTTVFGYSEGAAVASKWLAEYAQDHDARSPSDLHFVLTGNPQRKYGGSRNIYPWTPTMPSSEYTVLDVAREYDGVADVPDEWWNILALLNASWGYAFVHTSYTPVDLTSDDKLVWQDGNTTYVLVRTPDLPILMPLRLMGLGFLADALNAPLKAIIDSAYHRDYPGIITDPAAAQKVVDDALQGKSGTLAASADPTPSLTTAAAATAAALVSTPSTDKPAAPAASDDAASRAPAATVEPSAKAAKDVAAQPITVDTPVEVPETPAATPSADPSDTPDPSTATAKAADPQASPDEPHPGVAPAAASSDPDGDGHVGRHRAPEAAGASAPADTSSTSSTSCDDAGPRHAKPTTSSDDAGPRHAKPAAASGDASSSPSA